MRPDGRTPDMNTGPWTDGPFVRAEPGGRVRNDDPLEPTDGGRIEPPCRLVLIDRRGG